MTNAQNTVVVDAGAEYLGYANVFETIANGGAFVFGSGWGVADIKTVVDPTAGTITLQPNYNTYADNPGDPFWIDAATGLGNKIFEGNSFVENNTDLIGNELTFTGGILEYTLDPTYVTIAFIKVFNADFSFVKEVRTESNKPVFDEASFKKGAEYAYEMIINAFAKGDKQSLKPLLTKKLYLDFEKIIDDRNE